jgi:hypothetical protein
MAHCGLPRFELANPNISPTFNLFVGLFGVGPNLENPKFSVLPLHHNPLPKCILFL